MNIPKGSARATWPVVIWIGLAFVAGIGIWALVYWHTDGGEQGPKLLVSVGTSGLALAFGGVLGGLIKKLFDAWDERKMAVDIQTAYFAQLLEDFKTIYNMVERMRFLIVAHKSAKTYGDCLRDLPDATILLHNVKRATRQGFPDLYKDLEAPIFFCMIFIKKLVVEYRENYLMISRLQSQDEANNKVLRSEIANRVVSIDLELSHSAWDDIKALPCLKIPLDAVEDAGADGNAHFEAYDAAFVQHIDLASYVLMRRMPGSDASTRDPEMEALISEARADMQRAKARYAGAR